jgi:hypothetical protein
MPASSAKARTPETVSQTERFNFTGGEPAASSSASDLTRRSQSHTPTQETD